MEFWKGLNMKTILKCIGCFILALGIFFGLMMSIAMGSALGRMFYDEYKNEIPNTEKTDINAVTRSVSDDMREYTDLSNFYPNGNSNYKYYAIYLTENRKYQISWFTTNTQGQLYGLKNCVKDFTSEEITKFNPSYSKYYYLGMEELMLYATAMAGAEMGTTSFNGLQADEGYFTVSSSFDSDVYTSNSYDTLDDLYSAIFYKDVSYSSSKEIKKSLINIYFDINILSSVSIFDTSTCYSNYDEMIPTFELPLNSSGEVELIFYTEVTSDNLLDKLNGLSSVYDEGYNNGYNDGYDTGLDQYKYGIFADAVLDSVVMEADGYKIPNAKLDFITGGISTNTIANLVSVRVDSNPEIYENNQRFTIMLTLNPFTWQQGLLYTQSVYAYRSMVFISNTGTRYAMNISEDKGASNDIFGSTYYMIKEASSIPSTTVITKIEIECANFDYTPVFLQPTGGYNAGYNSGFNAGKVQGYNEGYDKAMSVSNNLFSYILSVAQVPVNMIQDMLDFEILGVNMANFVLSIFTACLVIVVLKIFI